MGHFRRTHSVANDLLANRGTGGLWKFLNNQDWIKIPTPGNLPATAIATGDLDGDGFDEVIASFSSGLFARYGNTWTRLRTNRPLHVITADLDGNGQDDIVADFGGLGLFVWRNNVGPWVRTRPNALPATTVTQGLFAGDLDGNGREDVVAIFGNVLWGRYQGSWRVLHRTQKPLRVAVGDLDGNGKDDVFAQFKDIGILLRLNESPWTRIHPGLTQGLAAGDVDGNDRDDLIVAFPLALRQRYDNGIWRKISDKVPQNVITADLDDNGKDDVIGSFKGLGLLARYNDGNGPWRKIGPNAQQVAAGGFD